MPINVKILAGPERKFNALQQALGKYANVKQDGNSLLVHRDGVHSNLKPASDYIELGISYHSNSNLWTYRGEFFNLPVNLTMPPEVFFRLLQNLMQAYVQPRKSFFEWAMKYRERYGDHHSQMLYKLGLQLVGTGTMVLGLDHPNFARWDSMTSDFKVWFSIRNEGISSKMFFGMFEEPNTHIFEASKEGYLLGNKIVSEVQQTSNSIVSSVLDCLSSLSTFVGVDIETKQGI